MAHGKKDQVLGTIKEKVGRVFGNEDLERKGMEQKGEGTIEHITYKNEKQVEKNIKNGDPLNKDVEQIDPKLTADRIHDPAARHGKMDGKDTTHGTHTTGANPLHQTGHHGVHDSTHATSATGANPLHTTRHHGVIDSTYTTATGADALHMGGCHEGTHGVHDSTSHTSGVNPLHPGTHGVHDSTTHSSGLNPLHKDNHGVHDSTHSSGINPLHKGSHGDDDSTCSSGINPLHKDKHGVHDSTPSSGINPLYRDERHLQNEREVQHPSFITGAGSELSHNDRREILGGFAPHQSGYDSRHDSRHDTLQNNLGFQNNTNDLNQNYEGRNTLGQNVNTGYTDNQGTFGDRNQDQRLGGRHHQETGIEGPNITGTHHQQGQQSLGQNLGQHVTGTHLHHEAVQPCRRHNLKQNQTQHQNLTGTHHHQPAQRVIGESVAQSIGHQGHQGTGNLGQNLSGTHHTGEHFSGNKHNQHLAEAYHQQGQNDPREEEPSLGQKFVNSITGAVNSLTGRQSDEGQHNPNQTVTGGQRSGVHEGGLGSHHLKEGRSDQQGTGFSDLHDPNAMEQRHNKYGQNDNDQRGTYRKTHHPELRDDPLMHP